MNKLMTLGVVLSAVDMFSKPLSKMNSNISTLSNKFKNIKLDNVSKDINKIEEKITKLNNINLKLNEKFDSLKQKTGKINDALNAVDKELTNLSKKKLKLQEDFKKGKISADDAYESIYAVQKEIDKLNSKKINIKKELSATNAEFKKTKSEIDRTNSLIDKLNSKKLTLKSKLDEVKEATNEVNKRLRKMATNIAKVSTVAATMGHVLTAPLKDMIASYQDIQKAQGDIASLGIDDNGIAKITAEAKKMSNQFAGVTAPEFIKASYDIKSGIASLSDEGVAKYTRLAALTAQATKSSTAEMTKLFALSYGIFKNKNETDFDFGKRISSSISLAVKAFRTDGSDLVLGISNIGATAKAMGVTVNEELAIIGNAKSAFNSAAEAGTAYRAFLANAVNAQKKLNLSFVDSKGKLLPMVDILKKIKSKFGEKIDANEMNQLKKAFGSEEAVKIITALINKTGALKKSQEELSHATMKNVEEMAKARNRGKEFEILSQRISNLAATFGKFLAPAVSFASDKIGKFAMWLDKVANSNSFVKYIFYAIAGLGAFAVVLGTVGIALSALITGLSFATGMLNVKITILKVAEFTTKSYAAALKIAAVATRVFNFALRMNPIGLVITAITALIGVVIYLYNKFQWFRDGVANIWDYIKKIFSWNPATLIIKNWSSITAFFSSFWIRIKGGFSKGVGFIANTFVAPISYIKKGWDAILGWISAKIKWITSIAGKIKKFFGFGDKKQLNIKQEETKEIKIPKFKAPSIATNNIPTITPREAIQQHITKHNNNSSVTTHNNNYTININVSGNANEIIDKIKVLLPSLIEDIEANRKERALADVTM